jgi:hypothetical protein
LSGGGALVAWSSLIAVVGFARVPVLDRARTCFLPVVSGLALATVIAVLTSSRADDEGPAFRTVGLRLLSCLAAAGRHGRATLRSG